MTGEKASISSNDEVDIQICAVLEFVDETDEQELRQELLEYFHSQL